MVDSGIKKWKFGDNFINVEYIFFVIFYFWERVYKFGKSMFEIFLCIFVGVISYYEFVCVILIGFKCVLW